MSRVKLLLFHCYVNQDQIFINTVVNFVQICIAVSIHSGNLASTNIGLQPNLPVTLT